MLSQNIRCRLALVNVGKPCVLVIVGKLCEIVKLRNKLARAGGAYEDFYDFKV